MLHCWLRIALAALIHAVIDLAACGANASMDYLPLLEQISAPAFLSAVVASCTTLSDFSCHMDVVANELCAGAGESMALKIRLAKHCRWLEFVFSRSN